MRTTVTILLLLALAGLSRGARADACPADLDGDGQVSITDLVVVLTDWGCASPPEDACQGDVDGDGGVDVVDLTEVILTWGCLGCTDEGEPCGVDWDVGCSEPWGFNMIECGQSICGQAWAMGGTRDTDWYLIEIDECLTFTATLLSEFDGVVFIVGGIVECVPFVIAESDGTGVPAIATLDPGTYVIFVATSGFEGTPCEDGNAYEVSLECAPCEQTAEQ